MILSTLMSGYVAIAACADVNNATMLLNGVENNTPVQVLCKPIYGTISTETMHKLTDTGISRTIQGETVYIYTTPSGVAVIVGHMPKEA